MRLYTEVLETPVGELYLVLTENGAVRSLEFLRRSSERRQAEALAVEGVELAAAGERADKVRRQLAEYFDGRRRRFRLKLKPLGTPFELEVWDELTRIPYGRTASYGEVAQLLGRPGASRAVGRANGANPIPIVVPCHRVIGADGSLTGYGGGIDVKESLLRLEGALPPSLF